MNIAKFSRVGNSNVFNMAYARSYQTDRNLPTTSVIDKIREGCRSVKFYGRKGSKTGGRIMNDRDRVANNQSNDHRFNHSHGENDYGENDY